MNKENLTLDLKCKDFNRHSGWRASVCAVPKLQPPRAVRQGPTREPKRPARVSFKRLS
jgi:hypothetical protein